MPTTNEQILSREIAHQIRVEQLKNRTVRDILRVLSEAQADIRATVERRVARMLAVGYDTGPFRTRDLKRREQAIKALIAELRPLVRKTYQRAGRLLDSEMRQLAVYEAEFQTRLLNTISPAPLKLSFLLPSPQQLAAVVTSRPFQGLLLKDWVRDLAAKQLTGLERAVTSGIVRGEGIAEIVRAVIGTRTRSGVLKISRQHAETWVRSAVSHTMNTARDATFAKNADLLRGVVWVSTLDTRTSEDCIIRDGLEYALPDYEPVGHSVPWDAGPGRLHPRCRSTSAPVLRDLRELGFKSSEFPESTRASMDGQVPEKTTFRDWAGQQSPERLTEIFGKRRAELIASGQLDVKDLFSPRGRLLTLKELRAQEAA